MADPEVPADVLAAHEAATDAALESILADVPDEDEVPQEVEDALPEEEEEGEAEEAEAEEADEGVLEAQEAASEPTEDDEEAEEDTDPGYTFEQRQQALWALARDGWTEEELATLPENVKVARGLASIARIKENDRAHSERNELSKLLLQESEPEATEGQEPGTGHPAQAGTSDPGATGADLTSLALPVAQKLAEMDDPSEVAKELASFVEKAVKTASPQPDTSVNPIQAALFRDAVERRLGPDFEGDLTQLWPVAVQLGTAGLHSDAANELEQAVALVKSAHSLSGGKAKTRTKSSTSRARKRGAAPPIAGRKTPPRKMSEEEKLDRKINAIMGGETDVTKLKSM